MFNKIINSFFAHICDHIIGYIISLIASGGGGIIWYLKKNIEDLIIFHTSIVFSFIVVIFICLMMSIFFHLKSYLLARKKIVNRIAVDRNGECYCPLCFKYLNIKQDPKYPGQSGFFCEHCNCMHYPYLENGKFIGAPQFYNFQKENPQSVVNSEIVQSKLAKELKELGLLKT